MAALEKFANTLATLFARLGGGMIVLIAIATAIDVLTRNLFGRTVLNSFEFSTYLFAIAISFGMSYAALCGAHIRVDVLSATFPSPLRRALDFLSFLALAAMGFLLSYFAIGVAFTSLRRGVTSSSAISFPLGIPQAAWAIGFVIFGLTCVLLTVRHGMYLLQGRGVNADRMGRFGQDEEVAEAVSEARHREN